ncbi:NEDD8-conjugating enzyme Ubc12 [Linum grandiflorum]
MIRLFRVKEQQQKDQADNAINNNNRAKKQSSGEIRLHKDITELNLTKSCAITFPNGKDDLMNFSISVQPAEGYYKAGSFSFSFQVFHPNIDLEGNVCLNILREDWKPVLNINTLIYGLYHLFIDPNPEDPLNQEAADLLRNDPHKFESKVKRVMSGRE